MHKVTKQIPLTQGQVALVDDWRYEELNQFNWYAIWDDETQSYYAVRHESKTRRMIQMHRQIMNTPKGIVCDHKNHITLDNQEHNLRNVTNSQNKMNSRTYANNKLRQKNIFKTVAVIE